MPKDVRNPSSVAKPVAPYSNSVLTDAKETLYIAGQFPVDKDGRTAGGLDDFEAQAQACFDAIGEVLNDYGMGWPSVVKFNVFMTRREDRDKFTELRKKIFPAMFSDGQYPISTLIFIASLYHEDYLIEIDATAVR